MKKVNSKNNLKGLFVFFATLAMLIGIEVSQAVKIPLVKTQAAEQSVIALTFPDINRGNNRRSNYTDTVGYISGTTHWSVANFCNDSWYSGWTYIKAGNKAAASTASIHNTDRFVTKAVAPNPSVRIPISKIEVTVDNVSTSYVNSVSLTIASNVTFTSDVLTIAGPAAAVGKMVYNIPVRAENEFYKLTYDMKKSSEDGMIQISKVEYFQDDEPATGLTDILVSGTPQTQYVGEAFDPTGLTFTGVYSDLTQAPISAEDLVFSPVVIASDTSEVTFSSGSFISQNKISGFEVVDLIFSDALAFATWMMDEARDEEACLAKFNEAKSKWNDLSEAAKEVFNTNEGFAAAKARLLNWAIANELSSLEDLANGGSGKKTSSLPSSNDSNLLTATIVIGVIGLTTLAGYYFLQKRKET